MRKSLTKTYQVDRRHIAFIRFILEAYEGIGVMTTVDPRAGIVALAVPPDFESDADQLMAELGQTVGIKPLAALT
jgi:hypothetical protein